jgi:hypothetical protein
MLSPFAQSTLGAANGLWVHRAKDLTPEHGGEILRKLRMTNGVLTATSGVLGVCINVASRYLRAGVGQHVTIDIQRAMYRRILATLPSGLAERVAETC